MGNKRYDKSFREDAIKLALSSDKPISQTAQDLGLKDNTLYNWISTAKKRSGTVAGQDGTEANLVDELNRLRKENGRLKEERAILKKAAQFFAKETT
jgi:transposase